MSEVSISINGRIYEIGCDAGQEGRVAELAAYINQRLLQIQRSGAAYSDAHLMVLTSLVLADEIFEAKDAPRDAKRPAASVSIPAPAASKEEEAALAKLLDNVAKRIDGLAAKVQAA